MSSNRRNYFLIAVIFIILGIVIGIFIKNESKYLMSEPSDIQDEMNIHLQGIKDDIYFAEKDHEDYLDFKNKLIFLTSDSSKFKNVSKLSTNKTEINQYKDSTVEALNKKIKESFYKIADYIKTPDYLNLFDCHSLYVSNPSSGSTAEGGYRILQTFKRRLCRAIEELDNGISFNLQLSKNEKIEQLISQYSKENLNFLSSRFDTRVKGIVQDIELKIRNSDQMIKDSRGRSEEIKKSINILSEKGISRLLILYAVPIFGLLLLILMIIPSFYESQDIKKSIFDSGLLLQLVTVFLLTAIILLLGIGNKLESEVLGTLLGGISVYVLQQSANAVSSAKEKKKNVE